MEKDDRSLLPSKPYDEGSNHPGFPPRPNPGEDWRVKYETRTGCPCPPRHPHRPGGGVRPYGPHGPEIQPLVPIIQKSDDKNVQIGINLFNTPGSTTVVKNYYTEKSQEEVDAGEDQDTTQEAQPVTVTIEQMYHKKTGKPFFPMTSTKACRDDEGTTVDVLINKMHDRIDPCVIEAELYIDDYGKFAVRLPDDYTQQWVDSLDKGIHITDDEGTVDTIIYVDRHETDPVTGNEFWYFMGTDYSIVVDKAAHGASYIEGVDITVDAALDDKSLNPIQNAAVANKFIAVDAKIVELENKSVECDDTMSLTSSNPVMNKVVTAAVNAKADAATTYTKTEVDNLINDAGKVKDVTVNGVSVLDTTTKVASIDITGKADKATTIAGYGITDASVDAANNKVSIGGNDLQITVSEVGTGTIAKTVTSVGIEANGVIKVNYSPIEIASTQVTGLPDFDEYVKKTDATTSEVENTAMAGGAGKTITGLKEVDGKISATAVNILIAESQVTNLEADLKKKAEKIKVVDTDVVVDNTTQTATIPQATDAAFGAVKVDSSFVADSANPVQSKVVKAAVDTKMEKITVVDTDYAMNATTKSATIPQASKTVYGAVKVDDAMSATSLNPVQNKTVQEEFDKYAQVATGADAPAAGNLMTYTADGKMKGTVIDTAIDHTTATSPSAVDVPTSKAVYDLVDDMLGELAGALIYKGTVSSTQPLPTLPTPATDATGWEVIVAEEGTYAGQPAKVGDILLFNGTAWEKVSPVTDVENKDATLDWDNSKATTVAVIDGKDITVKVPASDSAISSTSVNPVQNKVVKSYVDTEVAKKADQVKDADGVSFPSASGIITIPAATATAYGLVKLATTLAGWGITDAYITDATATDPAKITLGSKTETLLTEDSVKVVIKNLLKQVFTYDAPTDKLTIDISALD